MPSTRSTDHTGCVEPRVFVVSGPSGVGKGTIIEALLSSPTCPERLVRCTTATTRPERGTEVAGRSYFFLSEAQFAERIDQGWFLEWTCYNGSRYGTPRSELQRHLRDGRDVLLEIEVHGGLAVRRVDPSAVLTFVVPPSMEELERRLRERRTESEPAIAQRMVTARQEMKVRGRYRYCIENDVVARAADALRAIVIAERARVRRAGGRCQSQ